MKPAVIFILLVLSAALEVGGDALMRVGLHGSGSARLAWLIAGTVVLATYGILVNLAPWDFGKVLGVYVVLFFLVAQIVNWIGFGIRPALPIFVGGAFICAGGLLLAVWR